MADLNLALTNPYHLIQSVYNDTSSSSSSLDSISTLFTTLFNPTAAYNQIPTLTANTTTANLPNAGTLVKFRAMVQDTGFGSEVYKALSYDGTVLMYGKEEVQSDHIDESTKMDQDYLNLRERQSIYIVSVPGETPWYKQTLDPATTEELQASIAGLSLSSTTPVLHHPAPPLDPKYPIPGETHFGCVAKIYGNAAESIKASDVFEFVGIIGETPLSSPFDDLVGAESPSTIQSVPALHVLFMRNITPVSDATASSGSLALRQELIEYLAKGLGGDHEAAEWVLLALLARIHTRHSTGISLGNLSLNLAFPSTFSTPLLPLLSNLVPKIVCLDVSIPFLNHMSTKMAPRNRDENLESGYLQLSSETTVLVDMRNIGEGKLEETGVKNLQYLTSTIATQKLAYEFPYSSFELDTDLSFILLSEGKAFVPTNCLVYVQPRATAVVDHLSPSTLAAFRSFIDVMKHAPFTIPMSMSEIIQSDFVARRQKSEGGVEAMTQDDLLFRMTAARLMAVSLGKSELDEEAWTRTAELDERRKAHLRFTLS